MSYTWEYDLRNIHGVQLSYLFDVPGEDSVRGQSATDDEWVNGHSHPSCGECEFDLRPVDKRFIGLQWAYLLECKCCERELVIVEDGIKELTVGDVRECYSQSDMMTLESLERSIEILLERGAVEESGQSLRARLSQFLA